MDRNGSFRDMRVTDLEMVLGWRNAPEVRRNMYTSHVISMEEHTRWWRNASQRQDRQHFIFEDAAGPQGVALLTDLDRTNRNASWAFYARPKAPRGTGSRMEFLLLDHAFLVLDLHKLNCEVLDFNEAVIRLHQKFGFLIEGRFRDQHLADGRFVDVVRLGLLASEWTEARERIAGRVFRE